VLAPAKPGKTAPPIPHIAVTSEPQQPEPAAPAVVTASGSKRTLKLALLALLLLVVLGGGGFFAYQKFFAPTPTPPPVAKKTMPAPIPANKAPGTTPGPTPSETINNIAKTPKQAIDKAKGARSANDARVGEMPNLDEPPQPSPSTKAGPGTTKVTTVTTQVAQGVRATVPIEATAEASPAFRSFVQNAKISGVVFGVTPARAYINGQLARAGVTVVDNGLGITFDSVDVEKKLLIFKDKSGATVSKRFQ
jgi:hypothetical protein